jgi:hypothetical protein
MALLEVVFSIKLSTLELKEREGTKPEIFSKKKKE